MTTRILFVCLGNICRSPSAEGVFRHMAGAAGADIAVDSAGTSDWHIGEPPSGPMQRAAAARGYDLSALRARRFTAADFHDFDLIVGMDAENVAGMERLRPAGNLTTVALFTDYAPASSASHVPDPYFTRDFDGTLDLIEQAARGLLAQLVQ